MRYIPIFAAIAASALITYGFFNNLTRSFWQDEIMTFGVAGADFSPNFRAITADVHPPGHVLLVSAFRRIPGIDAQPELARLVNLLFLLPIAAAIGLIHRRRGATAAGLALTLLFSSGLVVNYISELRAYFPILALGFLLLTLLTFTPGRFRYAEYGVGLFLATLHFFGTALAVAAFSVQMVASARKGDEPAARSYALVIIIIVGAFGVWLGLTRDLMAHIARDGFWIEFTSHAYVVFARSSAAVVLGVLIFAALTRRKTLDRTTRSAVLHLAAIGGLVLAGTALISLVQPIVTHRNLIVLLPVLVLIPVHLVEYVRWRDAAVAVVLFLALLACFLETKDGPYRFDDTRWLMSNLLIDACESHPYFAVDDWMSTSFAPQVYPGAVRPKLSLEDFEKRWVSGEIELGDCRVVGYGLGGDPRETVDRLEQIGLKVTPGHRVFNDQQSREYILTVN